MKRNYFLICFLLLVLLGISVQSCLDLKPDLEIINGVVYEVNYDNSISPASDIWVRACAGYSFTARCSSDDTTDINGLFNIEMKAFDFNPEWIDAYNYGYIDLDSCLRTGGNSYACFIKAEPSLLFFAVEQRLETTDSIIAKVVSDGRFLYDHEILFTKTGSSSWEVTADIDGQHVSTNNERSQIYFEVEAEVPFTYSYKAYLDNTVVFEKEATVVTLQKTHSEYIHIRPN